MYLFYYYEGVRRFISKIFNFIKFFFPDKYNFSNNSRYLNHIPIHLYKNSDNYHKVAIVRNPYSRLISAYKHLYLSNEISFEQFCIEIKRDLNKYNNDKNFHINIFILPQVFFINDPDIYLIKLENTQK